MEISEKSEVDIPHRKEQKISPSKQPLPKHRVDELFAFFLPRIKTIIGKANLIKHTTQNITGVARIAPYQPRKLSASEQEAQASQQKKLQELFNNS